MRFALPAIAGSGHIRAERDRQVQHRRDPGAIRSRSTSCPGRRDAAHAGEPTRIALFDPKGETERCF